MDCPPWLDQEEQSLWRALVAVHAHLLARLDEELVAAGGVSLGEFEVMVNLSEAPGRSLRMAELATRLALSPSGLTRRVDGLVRQRMVERRACPSDARGSLAVLTDEGMAQLAVAAPAHVVGVRRYLIDPLPGPARAGLAAGLARIQLALDAGTGCPSRPEPRPP
ncbi:MAG: MarR family winged helix-turn-helix transcriptional regulator [Acidimicrobiales bacterium]